MHNNRKRHGENLEGSVREFIEQDRDSLRRVYLDSRRRTFKWLSPSTLHLSDFDRDTVGEVIWVAEDHGSVVGFIAAQQEERFIHHLFVHPNHMSFGFGSRLLEKCLAMIGKPAQLKCVASNLNALQFYRARGWQTVGQGVSGDGKYYLMEVPES